MIFGLHTFHGFRTLIDCHFVYSFGSFNFVVRFGVQQDLQGTAPRYLQDVIQPVAERRAVDCDLHRHPLLWCQQHVVHHLETELLR